MDTWELFTGNDILLALIGLAGFGSVVIVLRTALRNVNKRERVLRAVKELKRQGNLEPEESVLADK
jgi:hypothetical protein